MDDVRTYCSYGTLMNDQILQRVIGRSINGLSIQGAKLKGYCRLKVRGAHYPALLPFSSAQGVFGRPIAIGEQTVSGTLVSGLTLSDVAKLDAFEGDEYQSEIVQVSLVGIEGPPLEAVVYLYSAELISRNVLASVWTYEEFSSKHLSRWINDPSMY